MPVFNAVSWTPPSVSPASSRDSVSGLLRLWGDIYFISQLSCPPGSYWLDMLWCWHQTVYPRPCCCWSLIDILTQFYTGHYNVSSTEKRGGTIATSVECGRRGKGAEHLTYSLVTSLWMPGSLQSLPSFMGHTQPLSPAQCGQHSNFRAGEGAVSQRVEGEEEEIELDQWVGCLSRFRPTRWLLTVRKRNKCDILQQQKLYYCGVSRSWGMKGAVGNLDRVCGARKNFADVLIKNLTTN